MTTQYTNGKWYSVSKTGSVTSCVDETDAQLTASHSNAMWPHMAPHKVMQLVDVAEFDRVSEQRDELLAALSGLLSYFESGNRVPVDKATIKSDNPEVIAARAAILKAEVK